MKIGNAKIDRYVIADAKEKGYDSIVGEIGKSTKDFVVFSPDQILIEPSGDIRFPHRAGTLNVNTGNPSTTEKEAGNYKKGHVSF